ncbi:helix-turn-helix domain-containing protein [Paenibacillus sepulcri]|jgi:XRE family transcriptional regulator of biofilm formation|uniref:Helix-turn-helix domain-containing protein n=1 Tax=Paenibacillus sepulcri TaxID=359917 RepID=A0ABS7C7V1_9BACL|nr:helix-turn-helix domain-containing protein [Paenibacillus sepulcri]
MIGDRIKSLRVKKGYSITELADLAGVSKSYLSYIERNVHNNPSLQMLAKIAAPLDTSIEFLLEDRDQPGLQMDDILDEEWKTIIRKAVNEGMSRTDMNETKDLIVLKKWKEHNVDACLHINRYNKTSTFIVLHINYG